MVSDLMDTVFNSSRARINDLYASSSVLVSTTCITVTSFQRKH
jgi:hypothetical protein